jgi:hypothetical protein
MKCAYLSIYCRTLWSENADKALMSGISLFVVDKLFGTYVSWLRELPNRFRL